MTELVEDLARQLVDVPELTVVTNSIPVAEVMRDLSRTDLSVVLTGGLRTPSDALVGPVAEAAIESMHVDMLFMGVHGMDGRTGFTTPNLLEAQTNRAFVRSARRLIVVADHTKCGAVSTSFVGPIAAMDVLVTDDGVPGAFVAAIEAEGVRVVLA